MYSKGWNQMPPDVEESLRNLMDSDWLNSRSTYLWLEDHREVSPPISAVLQILRQLPDDAIPPGFVFTPKTGDLPYQRAKLLGKAPPLKDRKFSRGPYWDLLDEVESE
jgi:hypothetical protein